MWNRFIARPAQGSSHDIGWTDESLSFGQRGNQGRVTFSSDASGLGERHDEQWNAVLYITPFFYRVVTPSFGKHNARKLVSDGACFCRRSFTNGCAWISTAPPGKLEYHEVSDGDCRSAGLHAQALHPLIQRNAYRDFTWRTQPDRMPRTPATCGRNQSTMSAAPVFRPSRPPFNTLSNISAVRRSGARSFAVHGRRSCGDAGYCLLKQ